jgi:hypothetical protein
MLISAAQYGVSARRGQPPAWFKAEFARFSLYPPFNFGKRHANLYP